MGRETSVSTKASNWPMSYLTEKFRKRYIMNSAYPSRHFDVLKHSALVEVE